MAPVMSEKTSRDLIAQLRALNRKFRWSSEQVSQLNSKIAELQARYNYAYVLDNKGYCQALKLQLSTTEGLRDSYRQYAEQKAGELENIQYRLVSMGLML